MKIDDLIIDGLLRSEGAVAAIQIKCASRYSLFVKFLEDNVFLPDETLELRIRVNGDRLKLGPCRLIDGSDGNGFTNRLVAIRDIYDFENLFQNQKLVKLQSTFSDLPAALARKERIRQSFRDYTSSLVYDMSLYQEFFDKLDAQYSAEPQDVRAEVQKAIIETSGQDFLNFFNHKLDELGHLVSDFSAEEHQVHGFYFRKHLWKHIISTPFLSHCVMKPWGYSGDFENMRMIYDNEYQGSSTFAKLMHKNCVGHISCQSVRERVKLVARNLNNFENRYSEQSEERLKVLSVGCGPAREIKEVFKTSEDCRKYQLFLLDQDPKALEAAAEEISSVEHNTGSKVCAEYLECSVRTMLFSRRLREKWGSFNFIYSLGLFDYLAERVAKAVLQRIYDLLKPGGELLIGNFHVANPAKWYMAYWADWSLIYRTEEEVLELFENDGSSEVSLFFEKTGCQMFLHIRKMS